MSGELIDGDASRRRLIQRLLERRTAPDHWDGHLSSSALSTATAILALHLVHSGRAGPSGVHAGRAGPFGVHAGGAGPFGPARQVDPQLDAFVAAGARWLIANQNNDGGWGDTVRSKSNISTTAIAWASLSAVSGSAANAAIA